MLALRRPRLLAALLLLAAPAAEANWAIVGVTPVDGVTTTVAAIDLDEATGPPISLGTLDHRLGHAPVGVVIDERTVGVVLEVGNKSDGLLIAFDIGTGKERPLLDEVVPTHAPLVWQRPDGGREVLAVRLRDETVQGGTFDVVGVDVGSGTSVVRASGQRLWVTPVRGPPSPTASAPAFLVIDGAAGFQGPVSRGEKTGDGHAHIDVVIDGTFVTRRRLGPGSFRSPVRLGEQILVEQALIPGQSARLVDVAALGGPGLHSGRAGLAPAVSPAGVLAMSSSKKDGTVLVRRGDAQVVFASGRPGVARPQLVVDEADGVVVIALLDRGASLPSELWAIRASGARVLWPSPVRTALTVYGSVTALPKPAGLHSLPTAPPVVRPSPTPSGPPSSGPPSSPPVSSAPSPGVP